jgi:hypothetical protein
MSSSASDRPAPSRRDPAKDRRKRDVLHRWKRSQQAYAKQYAHRMECLADVAEAFGDEPDRELILHAAGTARMGQGSTQTQVEISRRLRQNFPRALVLLKRGTMFVRTVEILLQVTKNASDAVQHEVGCRLIDEIAELDAADVSRRVAAVLPEVESELEEQAQRDRHERAKANRGMWVLPVQDGMARIGVETDQLSAALFAAAFGELDRAQAELDRRDGVSRPAGQRQADLFAELPARYLALCEAIQSGCTDDLIAEAAARNQAAAAARGLSALGVKGPVQDFLPLGLPPVGPPKAWQLHLTELQVQLLRVPVKSDVLLNAHVPVTTLLELDNRAMRLDGAGNSYLPAFHARTLLPTAALRRVLVDHLTGIPVAVDPQVWAAPVQDVEIPPYRGLYPVACPHDDCGESHELAVTTGGPPPRARSGVTSTRRRQRNVDRAAREQRRRLFDMARIYVAVDESERRHDPSASLRAFVQLRDQTSRGVGCTRPAGSCDLDHRDDFAKGGQTAAWNLDAQGRRAHHGKDGGWVPQRDEGTGVMTWTSPLGFVYKRYPAWDRPPVIPPDATIPPVDGQGAPKPARDRVEDPDRPLWRDPRHESRPRRGASEVPPRAEPDDAPRVQPRTRSWQPDEGPPPF